MNRRLSAPGVVASFCFGLLAPLSAQIAAYDANVTPNVIYGDGNANGGFTVSTVSDEGHTVELGLRAHLRYDSSNQAQNIYNSLGNGTYVFDAGFGNGNPTTPIWNFDWSINTDPTDSTGDKLNDFTYLLSMDFDPGPGTSSPTPLEFDPVNITFADHSFGTNLTGNSAGVEAADSTEYSSLIANNNLVQQSWSYEFFNGAPPYDGFDPSVPGLYTISLSWFGSGGATGTTTINVQVVPEPATYAALMGLAVLGIVGYRRFRRRASSVA